MLQQLEAQYLERDKMKKAKGDMDRQSMELSHFASSGGSQQRKNTTQSVL
jgi:hypothetical protein